MGEPNHTDELVERALDNLRQMVADAAATCHEDTDPVWLGRNFALTVGDLRAIEPEIIRLRQEVERKDEALRPFAQFIGQYERKPVAWDNEFISIHIGTKYEASLRLYDLWNARAALNGGEAKG